MIFHSRFDHIVLLSAPVEVLVHRLVTRTTNSFGTPPEELARVLADVVHEGCALCGAELGDP